MNAKNYIERNEDNRGKEKKRKKITKLLISFNVSFFNVCLRKKKKMRENFFSQT